jgi:uncharacterized membrane-anchored protein YjiN (DUF445 family)
MLVDKRRRLRRMRRLAVALLAASLLLLILSVRLEPLWPWLRWVRAFAQAAAVGAIADWYAVVALFRHPLGLPLAHTAVIPRNQASIGASLGAFVTRHLLTADHVVARLARHDTAARLSAWLAQPANADAAAVTLTRALPALLRSPEDADIGRWFRGALAPVLLELDAPGWVGALAALLGEAGVHRAAFERALAALERWLLANEPLLRERFARASRYTPAALDAYIVRKFLAGVRALITEVRADTSHPLRGVFEEHLNEWARSLQVPGAVREALRTRLERAVAGVSSDADLRRLRDALAARAEADLVRPESALRRVTGTLIVAAAQGVERDALLRRRVNAAWLAFAHRAVHRHGGEIAGLIGEVVSGWDPREVVRNIELEIGPDLQYIRLNGALVGGIVGVALQACAGLLGG